MQSEKLAKLAEEVSFFSILENRFGLGPYYTGGHIHRAIKSCLYHIQMIKENFLKEKPIRADIRKHFLVFESEREKIVSETKGDAIPSAKAIYNRLCQVDPICEELYAEVA